MKRILRKHGYPPMGALGVLFLMFEDLVQTGRVPLRYNAMMLALISGGLSMLGMAQGLRLLLLLVARD